MPAYKGGYYRYNWKGNTAFSVEVWSKEEDYADGKNPDYRVKEYGEARALLDCHLCPHCTIPKKDGASSFVPPCKKETTKSFIETRERLIHLEKQAEKQRQQLQQTDPEQWVQDTLETEELLG